LILQLGASHTLLRLLLMHATADARSSAAASLLCSLLLALLCSLLLSLRAPSGSSIGSLPKLCCSLLELSTHTRGTCLWQGRKMKDDSRRVTCAAACLGFVSMCRLFWSRAKSLAVLGGTLGPLQATAHSHPPARTSHNSYTRLHFTQ
jgi:hypothetical protein